MHATINVCRKNVSEIPQSGICKQALKLQTLSHTYLKAPKVSVMFVMYLRPKANRRKRERERNEAWGDRGRVRKCFSCTPLHRVQKRGISKHSDHIYMKLFLLSMPSPYVRSLFAKEKEGSREILPTHSIFFFLR